LVAYLSLKVGIPADFEATFTGTKMDATARQQLMFKLARQPDPSSPAAVTAANTVPV
jgi:hypothetical protein